MNILAISANQLLIEFKLFKLHNKTKINILLEGTIKRLDKNQVSIYIKHLGSDKEESVVLDYKSGDFYHFSLEYLQTNSLFVKHSFDKIIHHYTYGGDLSGVVLLHPNTIMDLTKYNDERNQQVAYIMVNICEKLFPHIKQYACFDDDFFKKYPESSRNYAFNLYNYGKDIYTFDGFKVYSICQKLASILDHKSAKGKYVIVNLDLYSSINSIRNRKPIFSENFIYNQTDDLELMALKIATHIVNHAVYLSGLDGIIFTGEYGLDNPKLREFIVNKLEFMGFVINKKSNNRNKLRLSDKGVVKQILLIPSDVTIALLDSYILHKVL